MIVLWTDLRTAELKRFRAPSVLLFLPQGLGIQLEED
jgi:hypothetical protein